MKKNTWFGLAFCTFFILIALHKQILWLYWKYKRLTSKEQIFNLLAKHRFIEITGSSGVGKSWLLSHSFKHLQGVKFTNMPTPNNTLSKKILETHLIAKWAAPNKWYYFLDDINLWQKWCQQELGAKGYQVLKDYLTQVGKLGGTFIWTNNGIEPEHILQVQKNQTWKVLGHTTFLDKYSLLAVRNNESRYNFLPTIIAIDNKEMEESYDPHWNVPKQMQENWLEYIFEQKLHAEEGKAILNAIKESGLAISDEEWVKKIKFDRNLILRYLQTQNKKEKIVRGKKEQFKQFREKIDRYGLAGKEPTFADIEKWDKEDRIKKEQKDNDNWNKPKGRPKTNKSIKESIAIDDKNLQLEGLDQLHQDPDLIAEKEIEENENDTEE